MENERVMNSLNLDEDSLHTTTEGEGAALTPGRDRTIVRHLPYFVTLAEEGNFNRAAQRLGLSQSALTRRIQAMEQEMGVLLFSRSQRTALLTSAGHALYEDSKQIIRSIRAATRRAQRIARGEAGEIHISLSDFALQVPAVTATISSLKRKYPDMKVHLHPMPSEAQIIALQRKDVDVALMYDAVLDRRRSPLIESLPVSVARSKLAVNVEHRLAALPRLWLHDLQDEPLTWPHKRAGHAVREGRMAAFRSAGVTPNIAIEVMTDETTLNLAAANLAIGLVLDGARLPSNVVLRQVEDYRFELGLEAAWLRDETQLGAVWFVAELRHQIAIANDKGR